MENLEFRRMIECMRGKYYIINEMITKDNIKYFSAVKCIDSNNQKNKVTKENYSIQYISKAWIKREVFGKVKINDESLEKYLKSLKSQFEEAEQIKHNNIQELKDYCETDSGIFVVLEFCDFTLKDYVLISQEQLNGMIPIELKLRDTQIQILTAVCYLHDKYSLSFSGMLNIDDIKIKEASSESSSVIVKMPHPFMINIMSVFKIYKIDEFPSYFEPQVYSLFKVKDKNLANKKSDYGAFETLDLDKFFNCLSQNFDIWALGYLFYEMNFGEPPFRFSSVEEAVNRLMNNCSYKIFPMKVSFILLDFIEKALKLNPDDRLHTAKLKDYIEEFERNRENVHFQDELVLRFNKKPLSQKDKDNNNIVAEDFSITKRNDLTNFK